MPGMLHRASNADSVGFKNMSLISLLSYLAAEYHLHSEFGSVRRWELLPSLSPCLYQQGAIISRLSRELIAAAYSEDVYVDGPAI
jgi:hypothetical protein